MWNKDYKILFVNNCGPVNHLYLHPRALISNSNINIRFSNAPPTFINTNDLINLNTSYKLYKITLGVYKVMEIKLNIQKGIGYNLNKYKQES